jgi:hypothetical protein
MNSKIKISAGLALLLAAGIASSSCRWEWDCTGGQCRQVPICDSTIDIPPPRPPQVAPIPPPTIAPIPTPMVPPVGTSRCAPQYMCNGGQCAWETICR